MSRKKRNKLCAEIGRQLRMFREVALDPQTLRRPTNSGLAEACDCAEGTIATAFDGGSGRHLNLAIVEGIARALGYETKVTFEQREGTK